MQPIDRSRLALALGTLALALAVSAVILAAVKGKAKADPEPRAITIRIPVDHAAAAASTPKPTPSPTPAIVWTPAGKAARAGEMQVRVLGAVVGLVPFKDDDSGGVHYYDRKTYLGVNLEVSNLSASKKADYMTWAGHDFSLSHYDEAKLTDNFGNAYRLAFTGNLDVAGRTEFASLYPGQRCADLLVFERPVDGVQFLNLELPAMNFGGEGVIRFQIPAAMIRQAQPAADPGSI